jgi:nucleotide-binding universal stress UspA family protein
MAQTILIGIDGSGGCRRAAEYALQQAEITGARLVVVHVIKWSPFDFYTPKELETRHRDRELEIEMAQTKLVDPIVKDLKLKGAQVESLIRHGNPPKVLSDIATEVQASQIVIGRHGHSDLKEMIFGSVVANLARIATVPVTIVP